MTQARWNRIIQADMQISPVPEQTPKTPKKRTIRPLVIVIAGLFLIAAAYLGRGFLPGVTTQSELVESMLSFKVVAQSLDQKSIDGYQKLFDAGAEYFKGHIGEPVSVSALNKMGLAKQLVGDYKGAEEIFLYAYNLDPNSFIVSGNLANLYHYYLNEFDKAVPYYVTAIDKAVGTNRFSLYSNFIDMHRQAGYDSALTEKVVLAMISDIPNDPNAYIKAAKFFQSQNNIEQATFYYQQALRLNPESEVATRGLTELGVENE